MLLSTRVILIKWVDNDYFGNIVYGPLRSGKSSLSIQLLAEVYGTLKTPNWKQALFKLDWEEWKIWFQTYVQPRLEWDAWKTHMVFKPREFLEKVREPSKQQRVLLVWDDAGFWLSHYDYHNPFLKAVSEYMNVLATDWASVVFTTPNPRWLLTHVRNLPGGHTGRIAKTSGSPRSRHLRRMRVYEGWIAPDMKKTGVTAVLEEHFGVILPNDVYKEYNTVRRGYADEAKERMEETLQFIEKKYGDETAEKKREEFQKLTGL